MRIDNGYAGICKQLILACFCAGLVWMVLETLAGLLFLSLGLRLWTYHILPIWFNLTSPLVWLLAGLLIVPIEQLFLLAWRFHYQTNASRRVRFTFLVLTGCVLEVVINEIGFNGLLSQRLYSYEFLPTFSGSGSVMSPFYYASLIIHWPFTDYILQKAKRPLPLVSPNQMSAKNCQDLAYRQD